MVGAELSEKTSCEQTLVTLVGQVCDGAIDDSRFRGSSVRGERRQKSGQGQELSVQGLTSLSLNSVVLVSLLGGVDSLAWFGLWLGWSSGAAAVGSG